jgi:hypothetical protein
MTATCNGWSDGSALVFNARIERSRLLTGITRTGLLALGACALLLVVQGVPALPVVAGLVLSVALHLRLTTQPHGQLARRVDGWWRVPGKAGLWRLQAVRLMHARLLVLHFATGDAGGVAWRRHACFVADDALGPVAHRQLRRWLLAPAAG